MNRMNGVALLFTSSSSNIPAGATPSSTACNKQTVQTEQNTSDIKMFLKEYGIIELRHGRQVTWRFTNHEGFHEGEYYLTQRDQ